MKKSKNEQVQKFIDEIRECDIEKFRILQKIRTIFFANYPKINERIMYGD